MQLTDGEPWVCAMHPEVRLRTCAAPEEQAAPEPLAACSGYVRPGALSGVPVNVPHFRRLLAKYPAAAKWPSPAHWLSRRSPEELLAPAGFPVLALAAAAGSFRSEDQHLNVDDQDIELIIKSHWFFH